MSSPAGAFAELNRIADEISALLEGDSNPIPTVASAAAPAGSINMPTHHAFTLGMYARSRAYYLAAVMLVRDGLGDAALTVGRSLYEDSLRLAVLTGIGDEKSLVDGLIRWALDGVNAARSVYVAAAQLGVGDRHDEALAALDAEEQKLIGYRARHGTGRRRRVLFSEQNLKAAAVAANRRDGWWLHEVADQMVHGNYFAHSLRQSRSSASGITLISIRDTNPDVLRDVVAFAIESIVVAHQSACVLLSFEPMPELDRLLGEVETIQQPAK